MSRFTVTEYSAMTVVALCWAPALGPVGVVAGLFLVGVPFAEVKRRRRLAVPQERGRFS
ncbi:hypothetical protein [Nonomuraea typhae]|uniref:hypothetical protein n=1 Tax=Nonomuraea typhae TaxID=2603600 RepID=UPI0012FC91C3|nr:hypothetical protein [Nonomuraea typhae]